MRIKKFGEFNEAVSGTEVPTNRNFSYFGAAYGTEGSPNTIDTSKNKIRQSMSGQIMTEDEYQELLTKFLKSGRNVNELPADGFSTENIDFIQSELGE